MLFNDSFLTDAGANLFAIAASYYDSSDPTSGIIWGTVRTSNYDTNSLSDANMKALTDIKTSSTSYNTSGVVTSTIRNNDAGSLSIFSEINNDSTTTGSNAYTLGIWAKLANDSNETLVVVARTGSGVTPSYINPASAGHVISFVNLEIEISGHPVSSTTSAANWYASADALQELANNLSNEVADREADFSRAVTTHASTGPTDGENQSIYGIKTFENEAVFEDGATFNYDTKFNNDVTFYNPVDIYGYTTFEGGVDINNDLNICDCSFIISSNDVHNKPKLYTQKISTIFKTVLPSIGSIEYNYIKTDGNALILENEVDANDLKYYGSNTEIQSESDYFEWTILDNGAEVGGDYNLDSFYLLDHIAYPVVCSSGAFSTLTFKTKFKNVKMSEDTAPSDLELIGTQISSTDITTGKIQFFGSSEVALYNNYNAFKGTAPSPVLGLTLIYEDSVPTLSVIGEYPASEPHFFSSYISCDNLIVGDYILPSYNNSTSIGTSALGFKDLYLASGSEYVNNQQVHYTCKLYADRGVDSRNNLHVNASILPENSYYIGSQEHSWTSGYFDNLHTNSISSINNNYDIFTLNSILPQYLSNINLGSLDRKFDSIYANNIYGSNTSLYDIEVDESNRGNNTCSPGSLFIANSSEFSGASVELVANDVPYSGSYDLHRLSLWVTINGNGDGGVFNYLFIRIRRGQLDLNHIDVVGKYADTFIANHPYLPHGVTKIDSDYMWLEKNTEDPNNNYCYTLKYSNSYTGIAESFDVCTLSLGVIRSLPLLYNSSSYSYSVTEDSNDNICFSDSVNIVNRELYFLNEVIFRLPFRWGDITDSPVAKLQSATSTAAVVIGKTL